MHLVANLVSGVGLEWHHYLYPGMTYKETKGQFIGHYILMFMFCEGNVHTQCLNLFLA